MISNKEIKEISEDLAEEIINSLVRKNINQATYHHYRKEIYELIS